MPTTKPIPGIQRGPDFDREINEPARVERVAKEARQGRAVEVNDPVVAAALAAVQELADSMQRKIEVQWERNTGLVVITVLTKDGGEIIRRIPPEEAIRMAQNIKNWRSQYLDGVF
ncbi:MAG: flagellar protein FlaG [Deltaproteobacteria bacterium]|nr:flagellar protein FlaG [Deltaproteobacteria bacterium]